jgi:hypothetical protein
VETNAAEVYWQMLFQATYGNLKDTRQILPLADRARDLIE